MYARIISTSLKCKYSLSKTRWWWYVALVSEVDVLISSENRELIRLLSPLKQKGFQRIVGSEIQNMISNKMWASILIPSKVVEREIDWLPPALMRGVKIAPQNRWCWFTPSNIIHHIVYDNPRRAIYCLRQLWMKFPLVFENYVPNYLSESRFIEASYGKENSPSDPVNQRKSSFRGRHLLKSMELSLEYDFSKLR